MANHKEDDDQCVKPIGPILTRVPAVQVSTAHGKGESISVSPTILLGEISREANEKRDSSRYKNTNFAKEIRKWRVFRIAFWLGLFALFSGITRADMAPLDNDESEPLLHCFICNWSHCDDCRVLVLCSNTTTDSWDFCDASLCPPCSTSTDGTNTTATKTITELRTQSPRNKGSDHSIESWQVALGALGALDVVGGLAAAGGYALWKYLRGRNVKTVILSATSIGIWMVESTTHQAEAIVKNFNTHFGHSCDGLRRKGGSGFGPMKFSLLLFVGAMLLGHADGQDVPGEAEPLDTCFRCDYSLCDDCEVKYECSPDTVDGWEICEAAKCRPCSNSTTEQSTTEDLATKGSTTNDESSGRTGTPKHDEQSDSADAFNPQYIPYIALAATLGGIAGVATAGWLVGKYCCKKTRKRRADVEKGIVEKEHQQQQQSSAVSSKHQQQRQSPIELIPFTPHKNDQFRNCRVCKSMVHQSGSNYCQGCADVTKVGGHKIGENKALTKHKNRFTPYKNDQFLNCRSCKSMVHQSGSPYCQGCAYKKGICAITGVKMLHSKNYKAQQQQASSSSPGPSSLTLKAAPISNAHGLGKSRLVSTK